MKAYYKGIFKIHEVEIVAAEKFNFAFSYIPSYYYKYLIRFKKGKLKYVHEDKIIFG